MPRKGHHLAPGSLKGGKSEPSSKAKPGKGGRFKALKNKLSHQKGVKNPGALAGAINRAKYGKGGAQAKYSSAYREGFYEMLTKLSMSGEGAVGSLARGLTSPAVLGILDKVADRGENIVAHRHQLELEQRMRAQQEAQIRAMMSQGGM